MILFSKFSTFSLVLVSSQFPACTCPDLFMLNQCVSLLPCGPGGQWSRWPIEGAGNGRPFNNIALPFDLANIFFIQAKHPLISSRKEAKSSVSSAASTSSSTNSGPVQQEEDLSFFLSPEFEQLLVRLNSGLGGAQHWNEAVESSSGFGANTGHTSRLSMPLKDWDFWPSSL